MAEKDVSKANEEVSLTDLAEQSESPANAVAADSPSPSLSKESKSSVPAMVSENSAEDSDSEEEVDLKALDATLQAADPKFTDSLKDLAPTSEKIHSASQAANQMVLKPAQILKSVFLRVYHGLKTFYHACVFWLALLRHPKQFKAKVSERVSGLKQSLQGLKKLIDKENIISLLAGLQVFIKTFLASLKRGGLNIWLLPRAKKLGWVFIFLTIFALGFVSIIFKRGGFMPKFQVQFLRSFAPFADATFEFNPEEEHVFESFNSPLRMPEYFVQLNKVVVNLKQSQNSSRNPMGTFEFVVEAASQDAAMEVNDRASEVSEIVQSAIVELSYDELVSVAGKEVLKRHIGKELNGFLTKGRIRGVYIKAMVLKP